MFERFIARQDQRSRLFGGMFRRSSGDAPRDISISDAPVLARAISRCRACGAVEACETWAATTEGTEGAEQFCPNAQTFKDLRLGKQ
jgi:hypothetical protein